MNKCISLYLLLLTAPALYTHANPPKHIISISIPKCGTYLMEKCIRIISGRKGIRKGPDDYAHGRTHLCNGADFTTTDNDFNYLTHLPSTHFWFPHLLPLPQYIEKLTKRHDAAIFFIYRDPRDQVVSLLHHIRRRRANNDSLWKKNVDAISNDELLTLLIKGCKFHVADTADNTHILTCDVNTRYRTYLQWLTVPGVYPIRFEDIIGPQGGGSQDAQYQVIKDIIEHMGIPSHTRDIAKITKNLFGRSLTFYKGQIGSWEQEFSEDHKKLFKEIAGQLLIDLGYEQDCNW